MGVCQSSICQCIDEDALLSTDPNSKNRLAVSTKAPLKGVSGSKPKISLFSPTFTEATTPGSTLISPRDGPLSLTSAVSMANIAFSTGSRKPKKFDFDAPSQPHRDAIDSVVEEEQVEKKYLYPQKSNDENGFRLEKTRPTLGSDSIMMNPPLVAPPPGQTEALIRASKSRGTVNDRTIREFKKLRNQATLVTRKEQLCKREAKIDDRKQDINEYKDRWEEFQDIQKLCDDVLERPEAAETHCSSFCVNFRNNLSFSFLGDDDNKSCCQSGLSLLSADCLDAQRALYAEKRQARVARYNAWKMQQEQNAKPASDAGKRKISYFQACIEETTESAIDPLTPQISPPRLAVTTNGTKITLGEIVQDYGPVKQKKGLMTNMEVVIQQNERKDDTSVITDDLDKETWLRRYRLKPSRQKDDDSLGSSLVSYGCEFPASINSLGENAVEEQVEDGRQAIAGRKSMRGERNVRTRAMSTGVASMAANPNSLGDRLAELEKKMGIPPATTKVPQESSCSANPCPPFEVQSPTGNRTATFPSDDIAPTKLEAMFEDTCSSDIREQIVLRNSARSSKSVAWMNKEMFRRTFDDHAMIRVSRGIDNGAYVIHESANDESLCGLPSPKGFPKEETRDTSFASDVAAHVGAVLSKYQDRGDVMIDANAFDASFTDGDGKLFCA